MEQAKVIPFLRKVTEFDKDGVKGQVLFVLGNGQSIPVLLEQVSPENMYHASVHGISQRLGDSVAAFSKDKDYASAYASLVSLQEQLATKEWNKPREGGGNRQQVEDLISALCKLKKQDEEIVRAAVEKATPEKIKSWAGNTKVAAEIASIKKARADAHKKASSDSIDDIDLGE